MYVIQNCYTINSTMMDMSLRLTKLVKYASDILKVGAILPFGTV